MASEYVSGDVLTVDWDTRAIRVIQADASETFYDVEGDQLGWGLARARTATFYRMRTDYLRETSRLVRSEPLSSKEFSRLRPDLPMRCSDTGTLIGPKPKKVSQAWNQIPIFRHDSFRSFLSDRREAR
jgi:hypothetical protein